MTIMAEVYINIILSDNLKDSKGTDRNLKMNSRRCAATGYSICTAVTKPGFYILKVFFLKVIHHCAILKSRIICYWYTLKSSKHYFIWEVTKIMFIKICQGKKLEIWEINILMWNIFQIQSRNLWENQSFNPETKVWSGKKTCIGFWPALLLCLTKCSI